MARTPSSGQLAVAELGCAHLLGKEGFALTSVAFDDGDELDPSFTADEEDAAAPPLDWTAPPAGSAEMVLIVEDADAPSGPACHWLVWGLAPQRGKLMEGEEPPRVGKNAMRNSDWLPPAPAPDDDAHTYVFQLFAVDRPLTVRPGASRADVLGEMRDRVLGVALLTGTYQREQDEDWDEGGDEGGDEDEGGDA